MMRYFALLSAALMLIYTVNLAFALQDNSAPDTKSDFPESIKVGEKVKFSLRMSNPQDYQITDIEPIVEIMPKGASEFVHVEISPKISTLREGTYEITQGTIHVDEGIPADRIFVSVSFMGKNPFGQQVTLAPVSTFNASIKIDSQNDLILPDYFSNQEYKVFSIVEGAYQYNIPYKISNANMDGIIVDCKSTALLVNLDSAGTGGQFMINIPRKLLDSKIGTLDDDFFVLINGTEVEYSEIASDLDSRTLQIPVLPSSKIIEIIATSVGMFPKPQPCGVADANDSPYYDLLTPLKQLDSGIRMGEIQCKGGHVLVTKSSNGLPACVKPQTKQKLIERGWIEIVLPSIGSTTNTERQDIPVKYNGPTDIPSANNQFAIKFYSKVSQENTDNVFFSPASIFTAFAIAYEGAGGNTATEMEGVFGFEPNDSARHESFANMQQRLNFEGQNNTLSIANALWLAKNFEPYDDYVSNVENYYSGKVESVDFTSKEKLLDIINQWVHDNTGGKIEKIFETLDPETKLAITNAIYFKGMWEEPFEKDRTAMAPFHVGDGVTVSVPMMELKTTYLNQTKTPTARILELPYEGSKISMLILLPNEIDGIRALEDSLSAENIDAWQEDYAEIKTKAYMPKFKLETDYDLIPPLADLGVRHAFGNADFSGISALDLFVYKAVHKAIVEVNEEGTEAAAATGIAMLDSGPVEFRADHPFVFVIQDNETGQILFMGRVTDPTK